MVADGTTSTRAAAIEAFARALREVRDSAGNPSFRELAGRSKAISHTTLHEAAQGNRLPSWATTVEFVKACGADPADYRERWLQADAAVRAGRAPADAGDDRAVADRAGEDRTGHTAPPARPVDTAGATASGTGRRRRYAVAGIAALLVAAAATVAVIAASGGTDGRQAGAPHAGLRDPGACPIRQTNPPPAAPAHSGDAGVFVMDETLPDCSHVDPGRTVLKVWRFENVGTVVWSGYVLHRIDAPQQRDDCQTITDIPVPRTLPGHTVDVQTQVTTPRHAGLCFVRFKMQDAAGRIAFPASRPVYFQIIVR